MPISARQKSHNRYFFSKKYQFRIEVGIDSCKELFYMFLICGRTPPPVSIIAPAGAETRRFNERNVKSQHEQETKQASRRYQD